VLPPRPQRSLLSACADLGENDSARLDRCSPVAPTRPLAQAVAEQLGRLDNVAAFRPEGAEQLQADITRKLAQWAQHFLRTRAIKSVSLPPALKSGA